MNLQCSIYCDFFSISVFPVQYGPISEDFELFVLYMGVCVLLEYELLFKTRLLVNGAGFFC